MSDSNFVTSISSGNGMSAVPDQHTGLAQIAQQTNNGIADVTPQNLQPFNLEDPFWSYADLSQAGVRWNKLYPYRLSIWKRDGQQWVFYRNPLPPFTLPITPESLTVSTPFAITTTVTLGGIVEEHNGAPIRTITINATTGVLPLRGAPGSQLGTFNAFSPSILAAPLINAASSLTNPGLTPGNVLTDTDFSGSAGQGTGYYQFQLLQRFLEAYITLKKTNEGRDYILALEMWKDQEIYLVSPVNFERRRSAANPLEYQYMIQFKAWKRVKPNSNGAQLNSTFLPVAMDPSRFSQVLNKLVQARQILEAGRGVLNSVNLNLELTLFAPLRQATLFCKDTLGVVLTAVDLPGSIITELKEPILETLQVGKSIRNAVNNSGQDINAQFNTNVQQISDAFSALSVSSSKSESGSSRASAAGALNSASPANKIASDPTNNYNFFQGIIPSNLNIRPAIQRKIDGERRRIRGLKRSDFESFRDSVQSVVNAFQDNVGANSATYTRVYGLSTTTTTRTPTDLDFDLLFAMNQVIIEMSRLAVSSQINQNEVEVMDYFAGLAQRSGIAFTIPTSKFLVPFPYGHTLEQLSRLYLGDPDRWHEIAALNGLQAPYVDEEGFVLPLLANGNANTVVVSDASNLYVNQPVWISSGTQLRSKRHITKIRKVSTTFFAIEVDGDSNLSTYLVANGAYLQAFLPNTVNSQQSIFIPSPQAADDTDFRQKAIPGVDYFDPLVRVGGVDLLLTPGGDLVITPDGDGRLAVGLTNIVQKVRLALTTIRGSLIQHPDYGFPIEVGQSTADLSAQDVLSACKDLFKDDPTFTGVESVAILKAGAVVRVSLSVGIAGTQKVIPITVELPR